MMYLATHTETGKHMLVQHHHRFGVWVSEVNDDVLISELLKFRKPTTKIYYEHYKGSVYFIIDIAKDLKTLEKYVVYGDLKGNVWVRPESMFFEDVLVNNVYKKRFEKINI